MAVKPDNAIAGAVFYQRVRHRMGNTTLRTTSEYAVRVVEPWTPDRGYALCSVNGNRSVRFYGIDLKRLYDWSMYDEDEAVLSTGIWGRVLKVMRRKKCATCKVRHASAECPPTKEP